MLKKRVVATLVVKDGIVVQSINFKKYLPVGRPDIAIEFLNQWGIDEIILLDISASSEKRTPDFNMIIMASAKCYVPLTIGGGISKICDIEALMLCGADKISLNQSILHNPGLITKAAKIFGNQCVVASIDAVKTDKGYQVYDYLTGSVLSESPSMLAAKCEDLGAGEILINSVDKDGSYTGYDILLINSVCEAVSVPVIASGGARNANDFINVFQNTKVCAASAANFFHFTEHSVNTTKAVINHIIPVRVESHADYGGNKFSEDMRIIKKDDKELEDMLYMRIEKEII
jgi:cyclase